MKYLAQVEGNGNTDDIITPISYAGTEFFYRGFRRSGSNDEFCMISPFVDTEVEIRDAGTVVWNGTLSYDYAFSKKVSLIHNETALIPLNFSIDVLGKHKVEFILSLENETKVYRELHLWVNMSRPREISLI
jgi:hypothetical protein